MAENLLDHFRLATFNEAHNLHLPAAALAIECDAFRLLNEYGEPTLHDSEAFQLTDVSEPPFWRSVFDDGCRYAGPPDLQKPRLFEDWHDGVQEAIEFFEDVVQKYYAEVGDDLIPKRFRKAANNRPNCE